MWFILIFCILLLCIFYYMQNKAVYISDAPRIFQGHQLLRGISQYVNDEKDNLLDPDARFKYFTNEYPKRFTQLYKYYNYYPYNLYEFFPKKAYNYETAINYSTPKQ